jgi:hypothetical protein
VQLVARSSREDYHSCTEWTNTGIPSSISRESPPTYPPLSYKIYCLPSRLTRIMTVDSLHLRQRLIERIFEANLEDVAGMGVYGGYELEGFVDESQGAEAEAASTSTDDMGDYPVRASVRSGLSGEVSTIRA